MGLWAPEGFDPEEGLEELQRALGELAQRLRISNQERAAAIVAGADLEEALGEVLGAFMVAGRRSETLLGGTELRTFALRIDLAFSLGLIGEDERGDLHVVRRVRNHFAHEKECGFGDQKVAALCANLRIPLHLPYLFEGMPDSERFTSVAFVLAQNLSDRALAAQRSRRTVPAEVDAQRWRDFF